MSPLCDNKTQEPNTTFKKIDGCGNSESIENRRFCSKSRTCSCCEIHKQQTTEQKSETNEVNNKNNDQDIKQMLS